MASSGDTAVGTKWYTPLWLLPFVAPAAVALTFAVTWLTGLAVLLVPLYVLLVLTCGCILSWGITGNPRISDEKMRTAQGFLWLSIVAAPAFVFYLVIALGH